MSFKPLSRQEGFHLAETPSTTTTFDIFNPFLSDYRKFPSAQPMDFGDELASLIHHSNERSTQSPQPNPSSTSTSTPPPPPQDQQPTPPYPTPYRPQTHNIFDISAPTNISTSSGPHSYNSQSSTSNNNYNSTTTTLRYDSHSDQPSNHPPSSFHPTFTRHTPSPSSPFPTNSHSSHRSRSRSRPPSASTVTTGGLGPARTTRSRRNNSISGTSPPPARPHAIVIPRSRASNVPTSAGAGPATGGISPLASANTASTGAWFMPSHSSTSEYSLPTPDSVTSHSHSHTHSHSYSHSFSQHPHHQHHQQQQQQQQQQTYSPFSLSSPTLPPVSSLHSLPLPMHSQHHQHPGGAHPHSPHSPHTPHGFGSLAASREPFSTGTPHSLPNVPTVPTVPSMHGHHGHGHGSPTVPSMGSPNISSPLGGVGVTIPPMSVVPGMSVQDKQAALASEKRRRRRESHNAVERRRRDNINEKISELATLIPECMLDVPVAGKPADGKDGGAVVGVNGKSGGEGTPTEDAPQSPLDMWMPKKEDGAVGAPGTSPQSASEAGDQNQQSGKGINASSEGGVVKANKGMILRKSVEYIRYLQQLVTAQGARNRELELELKQYRDGVSPVNSTNKDDEMGISGIDMMGMGVVMMHNEAYMNGNGNAAHGHGGNVNGDGYGTLFGLPSMPEGEGEEGGGGSAEGENGMDVEGMSLSPEGEREEESMSGEEREREGERERQRERDRGRTRGRDAGLKGKPPGRIAKKLKEESTNGNGNVREDMMVM